VVLGQSESIYPDTLAPTGRFAEAPNWELGTVFRASVPGRITHARVFSLANEFGDHEVRLWRNADNTLVAGPIPWSFGGDEGSAETGLDLGRHLRNLKGWISGAYYTSEQGLKELGWTGNMAFDSFPGCTHGSHA